MDEYLQGERRRDDSKSQRVQDERQMGKMGKMGKTRKTGCELVR